MTIPDQQTTTTAVTEDVATPAHGTDLPPQRTEAATQRTMEPSDGVQSSTVAPGTASSSDPAVSQAEVAAPRTEDRAETEDHTEKALFAENELSGLRSRWDEVQSGFVDDPKECVHKADGLVSEVVEQLTNGFSEARSRLEAQWARGEEASTEDLRLALKRYRDFFQRLLSV
jgi:hypothetical protein